MESLKKNVSPLETLDDYITFEKRNLMLKSKRIQKVVARGKRKSGESSVDGKKKKRKK